MLIMNRHVLMVLICLAVVMGWACNAVAHRRGGLPLVHPVTTPATQPVAPEGETSGSLSLKPDLYWQRLLAQEKAGEVQEAFQTGLALVNIFPQSPRRGAALLKLGELAKGQGETEKALEVFGLVTTLTPGSPEASEARLAASALELARDLHQGSPTQSLRLFLEKTSHLPPGYAPETLREALRTGWQAVTRQVRATSPLPLPVVEEILALWAMQPQGADPPEAACLLADLLQKNGLVEEAQDLLAKAGDQNRSNPATTLKTFSLPPPWLPWDWAALAGDMQQIPKRDEPTVFSPPWQAGVELMATPGATLLTWFLPRPANAAWLEGQIPALEKNLLHSRYAGLGDRHPAMWARFPWPGSSFSQVKTPQQMVDTPLMGDLEPFSQYLLGLNRLQDGHLDEAQASFQDLAQSPDPFWQTLARVHLADLELARLQAESAP